INILDGSVVDAKNIFIRGGRLVIADALVFPGGFSVFRFTPPPDGGEVNIEVTNDVNISGTGPVPFLEDTPGIQTFAGFRDEIVAGDVPDIRIKAGSLSVSGEAVILAIRQGPGNPDSPPEISMPEISITTTGNTVRVENGASIGLINAFEGPGGRLTINAHDVVVSGNGAPGFTGLSAQGQFHPLFEVLSDPELTFADAGSITVNAPGSVTVSDAEISATSFAFGAGGNVTINTGNLSLSNNAAIFAESTLAGASGTIDLNATGRIDITGGSVVSALTSGSGAGGVAKLTAGQSITVSGGSSVFTTTAPPSQEVLDNFARFFGVDWATLVEIAQEEGIPNPDLFDVLGLLQDFGLIDLRGDPLVAGDAGKVSLTTPLLTVSNNAAVSSSTGWDGNAGEVQGTFGMLAVNSGGEIRSRSGLADPGGGQLLVGSGNAGNITLTATDTVRMVNGSITTEAVVADGGNISITTTGSLVHLTDSQITTSVQSGVGQGGNITTNSALIVLDGSRIRADAFGGPGGNITIVADVFLIQDSRGMVPANIKDVVTASSALSTQGTISIQADITDVSGTLAQLPVGVLEAAALLRASCAARLAGGKVSTLVVAGREGLPLEPGGLLPSPLLAEGPAGTGLSRSERNQWETLAAERYRLVAPSAVLDRWCSR
ncbi:MAG: hypothetical protein L0191_00315, partial [Acidobacteria bacterium]|nr:hypothetical protein [Acidobacteriota bacterium]